MEAATPFSSASCLLAAVSFLSTSGRSNWDGSRAVRGKISAIYMQIRRDVYRKWPIYIHVRTYMQRLCGLSGGPALTESRRFERMRPDQQLKFEPFYRLQCPPDNPVQVSVQGGSRHHHALDL